MDCRNLVNVNDCYGPPKFIWNDRKPVTFSDCFGSSITLYEMWEPCNNLMTYGPPYLIWNVGTL